MSDMKWLRLIRKLKLYNIQKGLRYLKHYGVKEFLIRLSERMEPEEVPYGPWREQYCVKEEDLVRQRNHRFSCSPKISVVVPAYRTPEVFLRQMIESLEQQSYPNWELVIGNASPEDETMACVLKEYTEKDTRVQRERDCRSFRDDGDNALPEHYRPSSGEMGRVFRRESDVKGHRHAFRQKMLAYRRDARGSGGKAAGKRDRVRLRRRDYDMEQRGF